MQDISYFYETLTKLKKLTLDMNELITDCGIQANLNSLSLRGNKKITDKSVKNLTNLTSLSLNNNEMITDDGIKHLTSLTNLFLINNVNITNEGIKDLTNLSILNLLCNKKITTDKLSMKPGSLGVYTRK